MKNALIAPLTLLSVIVAVQRGHSMSVEQFGPASAQNHPTFNQPRWPANFIHLVTHESRVYSHEISGSERLYFDAKMDDVQELVHLFAKTRIRDHEVWLKPGPKTTESVTKKHKFDYNVHVYMPSPVERTLDHIKEDNDKTYDPTLIIFVDPAMTDETLKKIQFPDHFVLHNEITDSKIKGQATKPIRKPRHTMVMFDDSTPATQFENEIQSRVMLWEKGIEEGVAMGIVSRTGYFQAPISSEEIKRMTSGELWLTVTTGDWKTKPSKDHPRISAGKLGPSRAAASMVTIPKPE